MADATVVADFLSAGEPTSSQLVYPAVGAFGGGSYAALSAVADGSKLGWVGAGEPLNVYGTYVHEIIKVSPTKMRVRVDRWVPEQAIDFERIPRSAGWDGWLDYYSQFDDDESLYRQRMETSIRNVGDLAQPPKTPFVTEFVRWTVIPVKGAPQPAGVFLRDPQTGDLMVMAFPAYEKAGMPYAAYKGTPKGILKQMPTMVGRQTLIDPPEFIRGESFRDAAMRALQKFAADHYRETGRSAF